jgi:hypothetical protein
MATHPVAKTLAQTAIRLDRGLDPVLLKEWSAAPSTWLQFNL